MNSHKPLTLLPHKNLFVKQVHEMAELIGLESRNKYQITDLSGAPVGFAAEQSKGFLGWVMRQFFGHWRTFEVHFFDAARQKFMTARQPFRFFFQRLEISNSSGQPVGAIQQRFSILSKRFDVLNTKEMVVMEVASPLWKLWTFPFTHAGSPVASVQKKWSGIFSEALTDKDNFLIEFTAPSLSNEERLLVLAAAIYIDLRYFEKKAGR